MLHGIDLGRARTLTDELARWLPKLSQIEGDVIVAERLSDLPSDTTLRLDELTQTGSALARTITTASEELLAHRLAIQPFDFAGLARFVQLPSRAGSENPRGPGHPLDQAKIDADERAAAAAAAQALLDRIAIADTLDWPPNPADMYLLTQLFMDRIRDAETARAALALAKEVGLPASYALGYASVAEIEADLEAVRAAMATGAMPGADGLPAELFPAAYRNWAAEMARLPSHTRTSLHPSSRSERIVLPGLRGQKFLLPSVRFGNRTAVRADWELVSALAAHVGPTAASWAGRSLADGIDGDWGIDAAYAIAAIVASDPIAALALFNELGATGTAELTLELGADHHAALLPAIASALASVSAHPDLAFDGAQLITADDRRNSFGVDPRAFTSQYVERLLLVEGFDEEFLLAAARASFAVRGTHSSHPLASRPGEYIDPGTTAIAAIAMNGLGATLVRSFDDDDDLAQLFGDRDPVDIMYRQMLIDPHDPQVLSPIESVLFQAGLDPAAVRVITEAIGAAPEAWQHLANNPLVASGLSIMLAAASASFVHDEAHHKGFIDTYEIALRGGSGGHVSVLAEPLISHEVAAQLDAAIATGAPVVLDLHHLAGFLGSLDATRSAVYDQHPQLAVAAADGLANALGGLSIVFGAAGIAPGPQSVGLAIVSVVLALLAREVEGEPALVRFIKEDRHELATTARFVNTAVVAAVIDYAYRTRGGPPADPVLAPDQVRTLFDDDHDNPLDFDGVTITIDGQPMAISELLTAIDSAASNWTTSWASTHQAHND